MTRTPPSTNHLLPPARPLDVRRFLALHAGSDMWHWTLPVTAPICGGRQSIYGGCALGAALEAAEHATGRPTAWATCQFLAPARVGETVELTVTESRRGRAISHARVIGVVAGREVFICLVSLGERDFEASQVWAAMPPVPAPDGLPPRYIKASHRGGIREQMTERAVTTDPRGVTRAADGRSAVWVTLPGGVPASASALAVIGDEVSTGVSAAIEPDAQAPSIDNTLRVVRPRACRWVLAEIEIRAAERGFAHGLVNLWSPAGELLAIAGQTGVLRIRGA